MFTRRSVLQIAASATALSALPARFARSQPLPVRRSVHEMDLDDPVLVSLREFVTAMKDPSRNGQPVSWVSFANIHGTTAGFNLCPHGNWYFLPWHRAYVLMYERAVRDLTGNADFAMPYWDWTAHPDFPAAFGDESFDGADNPLFVPGRLTATGDAMPAAITGQAVLDSILGKTTFEEFGSTRATGQDSSDPLWIRRPGIQGELEATPHNNVHCLVRGPFMCAGTSPQDPIFQMHHCNIDRIWDAWNRDGHANSTSSLWLDTTFADNFIDPAGAPYGQAVNELLAVEPLGYTYVAEPAEPPEPPVPEPGRDLYLQYLYRAPLGIEAGFLPPTAVASEVTAEPGVPAEVALETAALGIDALTAEDVSRSLEAAGLTPPRAKVFLRNLRPEKPDDTQLRVFVNSPGADADTPTAENPNYLGTIGFFGIGPGGRMQMEGGEDMEGMEPSYMYDVPAAALVPGETTLSLTLVPVPQGGAESAAPVTVSEVELAVV